MAEFRTIECPGCNGEGGREVVTRFNAHDGAPDGYWETCEVCGGQREIEVEVHPITMEDLPNG